MATRIKTPPPPLYEEDFYVWAKEQAGHLRARRFDALDLDHLIQEVDDLGEALKRSIRSRVRTIIEHLLKLEHSPAKEPRSGWRATVRGQRIKLRDRLTPALTQHAEAELQVLYRDARLLAEGSLRDHGEAAAADALPETCPYTFDQITSDWLP